MTACASHRLIRIQGTYREAPRRETPRRPPPRATETAEGEVPQRSPPRIRQAEAQVFAFTSIAGTSVVVGWPCSSTSIRSGISIVFILMTGERKEFDDGREEKILMMGEKKEF